ncbi:MAG: GAF domain-containing protein [Muribaculaceae bacterium]|nr:GAF domain-containing protein [Muribaculaceae bacterium]
MTKQEKYEEVLPQVVAMIEGETNVVSVMANVTAALHEAFGWWWTGFYTVSGDRLELGPFQGPVACYRIKRGRGVCGTAWDRDETVIVPDVEQFPGHIACSSLSRSEIVVPMHDSASNVVAVLDIDSKDLNTFDETDKIYLEKLVSAISKSLNL